MADIIVEDSPPPKNLRHGATWSERYGRRHQLVRIVDLPVGFVPPKKVRIYRRHKHLLLQWWDPRAKANLCERINGDLLDALAKAREIDNRLVELRTSDQGRRRLTHTELVSAFLQDLHHRADAGEIAPATVTRYEDALRHYVRFVGRVAVEKEYRHAASANREFGLAFAAFLNGVLVAPNGHPNGTRRLMRRADYVLDVTRAMFEWAADPNRGNLLPSEFRNPFLKGGIQRRRPAVDPLAELDINMDMAAAFLNACDPYQLCLFAPMILFGLRASEPRFLFYEYMNDNWLSVVCIASLGYSTKGNRDKKMPVSAPMNTLLGAVSAASRRGLIFARRGVVEGSEKPKLLGAGLEELIHEYQARCQRADTVGSAARGVIRDSVLRDAGGLNYDLIQGEFRRVAGALGWPATATLKDFRHLFSTAMANAGLPEQERRFLLGHAPAEGAVNTYTHLTKLGEHYQRAVEQEFQPVVEVLNARVL